jgi:hypothetical protein
MHIVTVVIYIGHSALCGQLAELNLLLSYDGLSFTDIRDCIQKFPDWPPGERTANDTDLYH